MIDYDAEKGVAEWSAIVGIAGGGLVAFGAHNWGWGLLAALMCMFLAWLLLQIARTPPAPTPLSANPLDVLKAPRRQWPSPLHDQELAPWPPPLYERQRDDESQPPLM